MKRLQKQLVCNAVVLCSALLFSQNSMAQYNHGEENTLRIAAYNIHNGLTCDASVRDFKLQAKVIEKMNPDVISVEEVDSACTRSEKQYCLGAYAELLGMYSYYAPAIRLGEGFYGIGCMSKKKPLKVRQIPLPGREEARTAKILEFPNYVFCGTHFSLEDDERAESIRILAKEAKKYDKPFIIAGDLNIESTHASLNVLKDNFRILNDLDKPTWPADKPEVMIDYIAVDKKHADMITLFKKEVVNETYASDHRPIYVDVRINTPLDKLLYSKPYLQDMTSNAVTVMYQTNVVTHTWIEYGKDQSNLKTARTLLAGQEPCFDIENKIRISDLEPGVKYYYRVCAQEILENKAYHKVLGKTYKSPFYSFTLPSPEGKDFTMAILNDLHEQDNVMNKLFNVLKDKGIKYDISVFNGDCVPEPADRTQAIIRTNVLTSAADAANIPTLIIRGNHEIRNSYSAGMLSLTENFGGKTYGAFSIGDTRFVVLDCGEDKADDTWVYYGLNDFSKLRQDQALFLAKEIRSKEFKKAKRRILMQHIPIWGPEESFTDGYHPWTNLWAPELNKAKFDMNITAHGHKYFFMEKGEKKNPYPVISGGGPTAESATIMVLQKKEKSLNLKVFDINGKTILDRNF